MNNDSQEAFIRPSNAGGDTDNGVGGGNDADDEESTVAMLPPHIVLSRLLGLPGYESVKKLKKKQKPKRIQLREECQRRYDNSNDRSKPSIPNGKAPISELVEWLKDNPITDQQEIQNLCRQFDHYFPGATQTPQLSRSEVLARALGLEGCDYQHDERFKGRPSFKPTKDVLVEEYKRRLSLMRVEINRKNRWKYPSSQWRLGDLVAWLRENPIQSSNEAEELRQHVAELAAEIQNQEMEEEEEEAAVVEEEPDDNGDDDSADDSKPSSSHHLLLGSQSNGVSTSGQMHSSMPAQDEASDTKLSCQEATIGGSHQVGEPPKEERLTVTRTWRDILIRSKPVVDGETTSPQKSEQAHSTDTSNKVHSSVEKDKEWKFSLSDDESSVELFTNDQLMDEMDERWLATNDSFAQYARDHNTTDTDSCNMSWSKTDWADAEMADRQSLPFIDKGLAHSDAKSETAEMSDGSPLNASSLGTIRRRSSASNESFVWMVFVAPLQRCIAPFSSTNLKMDAQVDLDRLDPDSDLHLEEFDIEQALETVRKKRRHATRARRAKQLIRLLALPVLAFVADLLFGVLVDTKVFAPASIEVLQRNGTDFPGNNHSCEARIDEQGPSDCPTEEPSAAPSVEPAVACPAHLVSSPQATGPRMDTF